MNFAASRGRDYAGQNRVRENAIGYLFMLPALCVLCYFLLVPAIRLFSLSFTNYALIAGKGDFIGLDNYKNMLGDRDFINALKVTLHMVLLIVPIQTALALTMAVFVNQPFRAVNAFRTVFFIPAIISFVAVCVMFKQMYSPSFGLANTMLGALGIPRLQYLSNVRQALPSIVFTCVWKSWGYFMVIFLSGLQEIPGELREAARIDGAGPVKEFLFITIPHLKKVTLFVVVITTMDAIKLFIPTFVMTSGNPRGATDVVVHYIWRSAFRLERVGYAAAMSTVLFMIIVLVTLAQFRLGERKEDA
ncbi:MAG: sugar ABC transporter permease [Eubacteriales bacterium]|nr:sugar ABC transporter permease [Christensenellaceae bacterium]MEA5066101.1 sugar ABC transporter permease [Eubacteriales bacterium]